MSDTNTIRKHDEDDESENLLICDRNHPHDNVQTVKNLLPDDEFLGELADLFKIFGDTTRIKILYILFESEMCVCEIAQILGMTQSAISHQLKTLKQSKLVKFRRDGKSILYSLADSHVRTILGQGSEHINE